MRNKKAGATPNATKEYRATSRVDRETKERLQAIVEKYPTVLDESKIIELGLRLILPKIEAGNFNPLKVA